MKNTMKKTSKVHQLFNTYYLTHYPKLPDGTDSLGHSLRILHRCWSDNKKEMKKTKTCIMLLSISQNSDSQSLSI